MRVSKRLMEIVANSELEKEGFVILPNILVLPNLASALATGLHQTL